MSTTPRLTFIGLYNYDNTIFNQLTLPTGVDKTTAIITFLRVYGECPVLYSDPDFIKSMLGIWSVQNEEPIARIYRALSEEYNPLHNFDRHEEYSDSESSSETASYTGSETTAYTGSDATSESESSTSSETDEATISAFNNAGYQPDNKNQRDGEIGRESSRDYERDLLDTHARNLADSRSGNRRFTHTGHLYGNIGVTKSQEMAIDEVELRMKYDIYGVVADMLHRDFCLYLY